MSENLDEEIIDKLTENIVILNSKIEDPRGIILPAKDIADLSRAIVNLILARKELEYIDNS